MTTARRRLRRAAANGLRLIAPFAAGCDGRRPSHPKVGRGHTTPLAPAGNILLGRRMARDPIRFGIQTAQQGIEWPQLLDLWQKADAWRTILGMFTDSRTTVQAKHNTVTDATGLPKPVQKPHPPIMIGGKGRQVLLRIVARYADMWNIGASAAEMRDLIGVIRRHGDA